MGNYMTVNNTTYLSMSPWPLDDTQRRGTFELYPSWRGKRHDVYKGLSYAKEDKYTESKRNIVVKTRAHLPDDWTAYIDCHKEATTLVNRFNKSIAHLSGVKIRFADSVISQMCDVSDIMKITKLLRLSRRNLHQDESVLLEEYLEGDFIHFVSESGKPLCSDWELLEALVHFTHYETQGHLVLCNLKGVFIDGCYKLTNPTIHSSNGRFGLKDRGSDGISECVCNHRCNFICNSFAMPNKGDLDE